MASGYTEVFAWGGDHFGQLGLAAKQTGRTYCTPRFCSFNVLIKQVACGEEHAAFIALNGYVYTMGSNSEGRLGIGNRSIRQSASPCLVESLSGHTAEYVACGWGHTAVVSQGAVFTWGVGEYGALGVGDVETQWLPVQVSLPGDVQAMSVSCGSRHTGVLVLDERTHRKTLVMMGAGEAGQLGTGRRDKELVPVRLPFPSEEIKQVSCGIFHTGFVTASGRVYMMGGNSFGQLGVGTKKSSSQPLRVSALDSVPVVKVACGHHSAAISEYGELYLWGTGVFGEFLTPQLMSGISGRVMDVAVGGSFGAAVDNQNGLWTWGSNTNGELGLGDYDQRLIPSMVTTLQGKRVRMVACGGAFCLSLGLDIHGPLQSSSSSRGTSKRTAPHSSVSPVRPRTPLAYPSDQRHDFNRRPEVTHKPHKTDENTPLVTHKDTTSRLYEAEIASKDREIAFLKSENDRLIHEKTNLEDQMRTDNTEASILHQKVEDLNSTFEHLIDENRQKEAEIAILRETNSRNMLEIREKEAALAGKLSKRDIDDIIRRKDAEILGLMDEIRSLETDLEEKNREMAADRYRIELLSADKAKYEGDLAASKAEIQRKIAENTEKERRFVDFHSDFSRISSEFAILKQENSNLKAEISDLHSQISEFKAIIDSKDGKISEIYSDLEAAKQARYILTTDFESTKNTNSDLKRRINDYENDLKMLKNEIEKAQKEKNLLEIMISRQEIDIKTLISEKETGNYNFLQQEKLANESKMQFERNLQKLENEQKMIISEYEEKISKMRIVNEAKLEELWSNLNLEKEKMSELRGNLSNVEIGKAEMSDLFYAEKGKNESLERELEQVKQSLRQKEEAVGKLAGELQRGKDRERTADMRREEVEMELQRLRNHLSTTNKAVSDHEASLQSSQSTISQLKSENSQLHSSIDELKYEFERLYQQHSDTLREMTHQQELNEDLCAQYEKIKIEYQILEGEMRELERKNKEIFKNFEMELTNRAREFREKSMSTLATPSPMRPLSVNPPESAVRMGSVNKKDVSVSRDVSPSERRNVSPSGRRDASPRIRVQSPSSRRDTSPVRTEPTEFHSPVTTMSPDKAISPKDLLSFRDIPTGTSPESASLPLMAAKPATVSAVDDIRSRLSALQSSKADLASKMQELQRKLQSDPPLPADDPQDLV